MAQEMQSYNFEFKQLLTTEEFENSAHYDLSNEPEIKKIVLVKALPKITSSEKIDTTISYQGKTMYNIVYQAEDGGLKSLSFETEWQGKTFCENEYYFLSVLNKENTITSFSAAEVSISSLNNVMVHVIKKEEIDSVVNLPADYVTRQETFDIQKSVCTINSTINEVGELEVNQKVDAILFTEACVKPQSAVAGIDTVTLDGDVCVKTYALANGKILSFEKTIAYKEELPALLSNPSFSVDAAVQVLSVKATASVSDIDAKSNLIFSVELGATGVVYSKETIAVVSDAYSLNSELNTINECVKRDNYQAESLISESVSGSLDVDIEIEGVALVSNVAAVITDRIKGEDKETISGIIEAKVIANASNEFITIDSQIPFAIDIDGGTEDNVYTLSALFNNARLKSSKEIELNFDVSIVSKKYESAYVNYISNLEEVSPLTEKESAIRVHVVKKGEDLFAIAKKLLVKPEMILEQNPTLAENINENDRVVVYCPIEVNF